LEPSALAGRDSGAAASRSALPSLYRLLRLVVVGIAAIVALWLIGGLLMAVFAAVLLAVILHGLASQLRRLLPLPHWAALALVVLVLLALVVALGVTAGPELSEQAQQLREALTGQTKSLQDRLDNTEVGRFVLSQIPQSLGGGSERGLPGLPTGFASSVFGIVAAVFGLFGTLAVVVIAAVYFAASPATYANGMLRLVAPEHRLGARDMAQAGVDALTAWSAGQALDMLVVGVLCGLGLWFIGVPLALVLGVIAGLTNFVPYIGAIGGAVPAVIIAFSTGATAGIETIVLYLVVQGFEGNVLAPLIQNRTVNLPPALTVLSQTAFGAVLGLPGLIFATPLTALIMAVADRALPPLSQDEAL
jgi:predicted PurR-regulated permease PerM